MAFPEPCPPATYSVSRFELSLDNKFNTFIKETSYILGEREKNANLNLPNIITVSRGVAAITMLFFPVFSTPFRILYCWGGVSDMIDGPIARRMNAVSELGSMIDSITDLLFLVCSAILIFPVISLPIWVWIWVAAIGIIKAVCIIIRSHRSRNPEGHHSIMNKLTGFLLFCLPFSINTIGIFIPSIIVCIVASVSIVDDVVSLSNHGKH